MSRRLRQAFAATPLGLSVLLFVNVAVAWVRSYTVTDVVTHLSLVDLDDMKARRLVKLESNSGGLKLTSWSPRPTDAERKVWRDVRRPPYNPNQGHQRWYNGDPYAPFIQIRLGAVVPDEMVHGFGEPWGLRWGSATAGKYPTFRLLKDSVAWGPQPQPTPLAERFGFELDLSYHVNGYDVGAVVAPYWSLVLVVGAVPATSLARAVTRYRQRRYRRRYGLCLICGYDLRAHSPGQRCPECGTVIPVPAASDKAC